MFKLVLLFALVYVTAGNDVGQCRESGAFLYEEIGCRAAKKDPGELCPSSYECENLHHHEKDALYNHCHFQGKVYNQGEQLPSNLTVLSCNVGCVCRGIGVFNCAILDCPEWLGGSPLKEGCLRTYRLDGCCSNGHICPPFDNLAKCEVDGEILNEGQKFYPKDSCSVCVCQKGFSGKYEAPFCRPINCGAEIKHRKDLESFSAPVYRKSGFCCPSFYIDPPAEDSLGLNEKVAASETACNFGKKVLKLGEKFEKTVQQWGTDKLVKCECKVPPLLTCIDQNSD